MRFPPFNLALHRAPPQVCTRYDGHLFLVVRSAARFHDLFLAPNTSAPRRSTIYVYQSARHSCSQTQISNYKLDLVSVPAHIGFDLSPREMLLCKIFQKHNNNSPSQHPRPPQGSAQPASRGFDPAYPSNPMSRTAQWVAAQAQQEYQLVQRRPQQGYQAYQTSTVQEAQAAYRRAQGQASRSRRRPKAPLMDLSSLEGPPIEDNRLVSTPHSLIPRIREEPATPNSTPPGLLWKPLPPRPASAEPQSSRQRRGPAIPPGDAHIDPFQHDPNLRRVPAQRTRRAGPEEEDSPDHPSPNERSRSPEHTPHSPSERPRLRSHSSGPLIWLEDEEQWVVSHASSRSAHPPVTRLPSRLRNATTRPIRRYTDLSDLDVSDVSDDDLERLEYPPDYESHQFSPTYVQRYTYGPASRPRASARRGL